MINGYSLLRISIASIPTGVTIRSGVICTPDGLNLSSRVKLTYNNRSIHIIYFWLDGIDVKTNVTNDNKRFAVEIECYQFRPEELQVFSQTILCINKKYLKGKSVGWYIANRRKARGCSWSGQLHQGWADNLYSSYLDIWENLDVLRSEIPIAFWR